MFRNVRTLKRPQAHKRVTRMHACAHANVQDDAHYRLTGFVSWARLAGQGEVPSNNNKAKQHILKIIKMILIIIAA